MAKTIFRNGFRQSRRIKGGQTMTQEPIIYRDPYYNQDNFPHFIAHRGNWDLYANDSGYCASIPTSEAALNGCLASHFGDAKYVSVTLGLNVCAAIPSAKTLADCKTVSEAEEAGFTRMQFRTGLTFEEHCARIKRDAAATGREWGFPD
jgi:hypothetical protein